MKIVHISDIHLMENGQIIWDTDTKSHFDKAIDIIKKLSDIDAIIISGDLSNDGSEWSYRYIDNQFASIGIPTYCCPGNHDNIDFLLYKYEPQFIQIRDQIDLEDWKFYFINTVIPDVIDPSHNKARGMIPENKLLELERELTYNKIPTAIIFHHPAKEPGGWLNRRLLENRDQFNHIISKNSHVKLVLYGHIHYGIQNVENGILYSAAPSIGYAFDKKLPKFQIANKQEGFNVIEIRNRVIDIIKINIHD
jgi:Icc protein